MNITRHTAADLVLLLFAAMICGILVSCFYLIFRSLPKTVSTCKSARFPKYKQFVAYVISHGAGKAWLVFTDVMLCLFFAIGLLTVSFIFNSGNFRLSSVVVMIVGYLLGIVAFSKLIKIAFLNILFVFKWISDLLLFPVMWLGDKFLFICSTVRNKMLKKRNARLIARYTSQRLSQINNITEFGLIEKYYKELLK